MNSNNYLFDYSHNFQTLLNELSELHEKTEDDSCNFSPDIFESKRDFQGK